MKRHIFCCPEKLIIACCFLASESNFTLVNHIGLISPWQRYTGMQQITLPPIFFSPAILWPNSASPPPLSSRIHTPPPTVLAHPRIRFKLSGRCSILFLFFFLHPPLLHPFANFARFSRTLIILQIHIFINTGKQVESGQRLVSNIIERYNIVFLISYAFLHFVWIPCTLVFSNFP